MSAGSPRISLRARLAIVLAGVSLLVPPARAQEPASRNLPVLTGVRLLPGPIRAHDIDLSLPEDPPVVQPVRPPGVRRFFTAAGEVALFELIPWAFGRYVADYDFSRISMDTVRENFRRGFGYDPDSFEINQSSHPYHGSLFFNSARENGYGFWGSSAFALAGSLFWEYFMENTRPSTNDLVNTTLGGMTRGEVAHRVSAIILDNTATGRSRLIREIGAGVINPAGLLNRLLRGEVSKTFENPGDRFPRFMLLSGDLGYRRYTGDVAHPDQWIASFSFLYGDPFEGDISRPFDTFWVGLDMSQPGGVFFSRIEERGVLKGWELTDRTSPVRHVFGFSQEYQYLNNASQVFGAQILSAGLLSKYSLRKGLDAFTDASILAIPLAGIRTVDFERPETGRNYDYAPGGGARVGGALFANGRELLGLAYGVVWARTVNGVSDDNTLQFLRASVRVPLFGIFAPGAAYSWYHRKTTYPGAFEDRRTQGEWRVFMNLAVPLS